MTRKIIISLVIVVAVFLLFALASVPFPYRANKEITPFKPTGKCKSGVTVFVSDTQLPIPVETLFLEENRNEFARDMILRKILEERPAAVFHLGDLVAFGYDSENWKPIDRFTLKLQKDSVDFFPIVGNHEYLIFSQRGKENFFGRYPYAKESGYAVMCGPIKIILLNSVFGKMSEAEIEKQQEFYRRELLEAKKDSSVKFVIVGTHYSPFTNSKIVRPDKDVREKFLPEFFECEKAKLFLSGHAHAFEHFRFRGKDFFVIGGGGGLQQPLYVGEDVRYDDLFEIKTSKRMFHFLEVFVENDTLKVELQMIRKNFEGFDKSLVLKVAGEK